ncbi:MAG: nucleotidyltransferase, partial [Xanthomonadales bacterium]|nr:nucleotidyltransferase [Xanthomonadales bacterium]
WNRTEEFIEDMFPVDVRGHMKLDCEVKQHGFRKFFLRAMLSSRTPLKSNKKLEFHISEISAEEPYDIYWKVLNRGDEAQRRDCIRGQIVRDAGHLQKSESTNFRGDHVVECYCVKDSIVVAKSRIHVPIVLDGSDYD